MKTWLTLPWFWGVVPKSSQPGQWFLEVARPDSQTTSQNHCPGCELLERPPKTMVLSARFSNDLQTTSQNQCTVSVFVKRPPKTIVLSALFSKRPHKTIVLAAVFQTGCAKTLVLSPFLKIALKEGFRKPWYCQHFSEGTFKNYGTVSIF